MAGFELVREAELRGWAREVRPGRHFPLYVAAVLAGLGLGLGFTVMAGDARPVREHRPVVAAPAAAGGAVSDGWQVRAGVVEPRQGPNGDAGAALELPVEFGLATGVYGPWAPTPEPAAPAPSPAEAAPVPVRPANPPAAPSAPASAPAAEKPAAAAPAAAPAKPNFYVPAVSSGPATALELELFERINAERATAGLAPYVLDAGLTKIARTRSQQLIDQGYFGHVDPYGYSMYVELLAYFGYTRYAWAGENLAMNNYPAEQAAAVAMDGLMNSPTHRANLLASDFSRIGVGLVTDARGFHYFTMIFLG
ncbi:CAP domain-containing protein [Tepidiforma sp.]|uniref:CAP domain-containing protein n=1 Tax=Tepidiforma sp. TaxID=2682230 RepID=UPI002ADD3BD8|nr:CAP domain-containing protein [Tepidiforma sp.]